MILVIGYGNPLRGDDGVGQLLACHLAERNPQPDVAVLPCHQLTPELAEPVSRARVAVFIDVCLSEHPGEMRCRTVVPAPAGGAFTHNVSPESLLAAARDLYGSEPVGIVLTIGAQAFGFGEALSPAMQAALPRLLDDVEQVIRMECLLEAIDGSHSRSRNRD